MNFFSIVQIVAYFQMNWPPFKRSSLITVAQVVLNVRSFDRVHN